MKQITATLVHAVANLFRVQAEYSLERSMFPKMTAESSQDQKDIFEYSRKVLANFLANTNLEDFEVSDLINSIIKEADYSLLGQELGYSKQESAEEVYPD